MTDHDGTHEHGAGTDEDAASFWDARYAERDQFWSGRPNAALVDVAGPLEAGQALELGCGEGADSIWLAEQGWTVTAVDVAATAVARARAHAAARAVPEGRITWLVEDLEAWRPSGSYDLVTACFLHSPVPFARTEVLRRAAGAVVRGGHLLVVAHAEPPPWHRGHDGAEHRFLGPDEELAALELDPGQWRPVLVERRERTATGPDGEEATLRDAVVLVRRR